MDKSAPITFSKDALIIALEQEQKEVARLKALLARKIIFVGSYSGDWEGMYIDGRLVLEGHSLTAQQALGRLGIDMINLEAAENWLEDRGELPMNLKDVKLA